MSGRFGEAIDQFLVIIVAVAVVLLLVVLMGSRQSPFRKSMARILPQSQAEKKRQPLEFNREYYVTGERAMRLFHRGSSAKHKIEAVLVQKVDERRRTIDPDNNLKLYNEYYELIFRTVKGDVVHLVTSRDVYTEVPFHQQGMLEYQGDTMNSFRTKDNFIHEKEQALHALYPTD